jgi:hypothetical protein
MAKIHGVLDANAYTVYINSRAKLKVSTKLLISLAILFLLDALVPVMRSKFGRTGIKTAQTKYGNRLTAVIRNRKKR